MSESTSELEGVVQELAAELDHPPNKAEIELYSDHSASAIIDQFGSLKAAWEAAGLSSQRSLQPAEPITGEVNMRRAEIPSHTDLLQNIYLTGKTTSNIPSPTEIERSDLYDPADYQAQFGTIKNALDISLDAVHGEYIGRSEIKEYLFFLGEQLDRTPYPYDMYRLGEPAHKVSLRFESWIDGLRAAGHTDPLGFTVPSRKLLADLRAIDTENGSSPSVSTIQEQLTYCPSAYIRRFGSWEAAVAMVEYTDGINSPLVDFDFFASSGRSKLPTATRMDLDFPLDFKFRRQYQMDITMYLLEDLHRLLFELGHPPRPTDVDKFGRYPVEVYLDRYGNWTEVLAAADIDWKDLNPSQKSHLTAKNLEYTLSVLTVLLGDEPTAHQINCLTGYSTDSYVAYFGSLDDALERVSVDRDNLSDWTKSICFNENELKRLEINRRLFLEEEPSAVLAKSEPTTPIASTLRKLYFSELQLEQIDSDIARDVCELELKRISYLLGRAPKKSEFDSLSKLTPEQIKSYYYRRTWFTSRSTAEPANLFIFPERSVTEVQEEAIGRLQRFLQDQEGPITAKMFFRNTEHEYYTLLAKFESWEAAVQAVEQEELDTNSQYKAGFDDNQRPPGTQNDEPSAREQGLQWVYDKHGEWFEETGKAVVDSQTTEELIDEKFEMLENGQQTISTAGIAYDESEQQPYPPLQKTAILATIRSLLEGPEGNISEETYQRKSDISLAAVETRWGSFERAVQAAQDEKARYSGSYVYSDDELLEILREFGKNFDNPPRAKDIDEHAPISSNTIRRRFGDFRTALREAGYSIPEEWPFHQTSPTTTHEPADIHEEIRRVKKQLGEVPTLSEFEEYTDITAYTVRKVCGSWSTALEEVGYRPRYSAQRHNREEIINEIQEVTKEVGWVPTTADFKNHAEISMSAVLSQFGSWEDARKAAGVSDTTDEQLQALQREGKEDHPPKEELLSELQYLHEQIGDSMNSADVASFSEHVPEDYEAAFGSILEAMRAADIAAPAEQN